MVSTWETQSILLQGTVGDIVFYNNMLKSFKTYTGYSLYPTKSLGIYYLATHQNF